MQEAPKEEAPKVYLGFLPKEEIGKCIENFKKALADGEKAGDKKGFELEIKGTNEEPKGVSFETYSITKDNYKNFVDESKDYMANLEKLTEMRYSIKELEEKTLQMIDTYDKINSDFN